MKLLTTLVHGSPFLLLFLIPAEGTAAVGDENWDSRFGVPGVNGNVKAIAQAGNLLYVGGRFSSVGGIAATNVAGWDGTNWFPLGGGVGGFDPNIGAANDVYTMAIFKGELYVGGNFTNAGGVLATNIAKWDGTAWSSVGGGLYGVNPPIWLTIFSVYSLASGEDALYAGGHFTLAGGVAANKIAKWDGANWSALGEGMSYVSLNPIPSPFVTSIAVAGKHVYVGGCFNTAGGSAATNIATWDGTNWAPLGAGLGFGFAYYGVYSVATDGENVYAGGVFTTSGPSTVRNIARWNGSLWTSLGGGVTQTEPLSARPNVDSILIVGQEVFIAGTQFSQVGGANATNIAKWDGRSWFGLGGGIAGALDYGKVTDAWGFSLVRHATELYVGGGFATSGNKAATNIAVWHIPQPLRVQRTNSRLHLSWPATGSNFVLEGCQDLANPIWRVIPQTPSVIDSECVVTSTVSGDKQLFRLRRP